jgi:hypothetical protein
MELHLCPHCHHYRNKSKMVRYGGRFYCPNCRAEVYVKYRKKQALKNFRPNLLQKLKMAIGITVEVPYTV